MNTQTLTDSGLQVEARSFNSLRRILVAGPAGLLEEGVARLLTTRQDLEVFHVNGDLSDLAIKVVQIHPEVIILCHLDTKLQSSLVAMLDCVPTLADLRIIIVHLRKMELDVYQHTHWFSAAHSAFFPLVYGERVGEGPAT